MKHVLTLALLAALAASAGCIASERLEPGQLDRWTALHQAPSTLGPPKALTVGERTVPARWVFRQNPSLIWSAFSLVRAGDRLEEGADEIEILVSPAHAAALADLMARGREALEDVAEVCEFEKPVDRRRWAEGVAAALAGLGDVVRQVTADPAAAAEEPLGMSAGPILHLLAQYLNQRTGGVLLDDVPAEDAGQLQAVLVQTVLRVGFAAAGHRQPDGLREAIEAELTRSDAVEPLQARLQALLTEAVERAAPSTASGSSLSGPVQMVLSYAPKALQAMEMLARQWDRMDHLAFTFHEVGGETVVAVTLAVLPDKEVRLEDMVMFQPVLAMVGTSRIVIEPDLKPTGETVIAFEPGAGPEGVPWNKDEAEASPDRKVGGTPDAQQAAASTEASDAAGGVELRFEGLAWGLARLLAFPLANGRLREIRVSVGQPGRADRLVNVALVMEADGARGDPRRLLQFQDVRLGHIERGPFHIGTVTDRTEQVFNYLTPQKRYTYTRTKTPETE